MYLATGTGKDPPNQVAIFKLIFCILIGPLTSLGGVEGLAFVNTKFANITDNWPDIEIHLSSATVATKHGEFLSKYYNVKERVYRQVYLPYEGKDSFSLVSNWLVDW